MAPTNSYLSGIGDFVFRIAAPIIFRYYFTKNPSDRQGNSEKVSGKSPNAFAFGFLFYEAQGCALHEDTPDGVMMLRLCRNDAMFALNVAKPRIISEATSWGEALHHLPKANIIEKSSLLSQ